tara:strand:+ start:2115 stop:3086 length:972 start_codon:yes stop_codon:yes gene_type:complete
MKVAVITGFPGQDACYLADLLLNKGYRVVGMMKRYTEPMWGNISYLDLINRGLFLETGDVTDIGSLFDIVEKWQPDEFYNLAAQSYVGGSWRLAHVTSDVDAMGPLNCLEAIRRTKKTCKFYQAGTSEMFGNSHDGGWQSETTNMQPRSPYGVAKLYGYHITRNMRESYNMFACSGILFNHESPIRGIEFVTRKVTDGVAKIVTGKGSRIILGNLEAKRDWGFAGDFVEAMWMMLQVEEPKDYVCATGKCYSVKDLCKTAFAYAGITDWEDYVQVDDHFVRPAELDFLRGNSEKMQEELGWKPKVDFEKLIHMMVDEDIKRMK